MSVARDWKSFWQDTGGEDKPTDGPGQSHLVSNTPSAAATFGNVEPSPSPTVELANGSACGCCAGGIHSGGGTGGGSGDPDSAPPVLGTLSDLANQLTNGYWGGSSHKWGSSTITVNLGGLAIAGEVELARNAMRAWERVANVTFVETAGAANISWFDDNNNSSYTAYASSTWTGGTMNTGTQIHISQFWYNNNGGAGGTPGVFSSYGFQTYIHELGHAIGLGHQGDYNGSATYGVDNKFTNDSWQFSVMSYMNQNNYGGASYAYVSGPQMADILAAQNLYGAPSNAGTHYYGNGPTVTGQGYNFANNVQSFTMYSADGWVALDSSAYAGSQTVNMNAGQYSSIRGLTNNISQYTSTNMTQYYGGSGSDDITLNTSAPSGVGSYIYGNGGADYFRTGGGTNHTIDGGLGFDTYVRNGASATDFKHTSQSSNGWTATVAGTDTLYNVEQALINGGTQTLTLRQAKSNFNFGATSNDLGATSDMVFQNGSGNFFTFTMQNKQAVAGTFIAGGLTGWSVVGTGDFNRDGDADLLMQVGSTVIVWNMQNGVVTNGVALAGGLTGWSVKATGDIDNDGDQDIILQVGSSIVAWTMENGVIASATGLGNAGAYSVVGSGDFNGDGTSDLILQDNAGNFATWTISGGGVSSARLIASGMAGWSVKGVGDLNGDGISDVVLQNGGTIADWIMGANVPVASHLLATGLTGWNVAAVGDYNGDGIADIALQVGSSIGVWAMDTNGLIASGSGVGGTSGYTLVF